MPCQWSPPFAGICLPTCLICSCCLVTITPPQKSKAPAHPWHLENTPLNVSHLSFAFTIYCFYYESHGELTLPSNKQHAIEPASFLSTNSRKRGQQFETTPAPANHDRRVQHTNDNAKKNKSDQGIKHFCQIEGGFVSVSYVWNKYCNVSTKSDG